MVAKTVAAQTEELQDKKIIRDGISSLAENKKYTASVEVKSKSHMRQKLDMMQL